MDHVPSPRNDSNTLRCDAYAWRAIIADISLEAPHMDQAEDQRKHEPRMLPEAERQHPAVCAAAW